MKVNYSKYKALLEAQTVTIHHLLNFFPKAYMDYDSFGNIYVNFNKDTKGTPILIAHLDNVLDADKRPIFNLSCTKIRGHSAGIGFDDKAGIMAIIELWERFKSKDFRIIFTAEEECGGIGAQNIPVERFEDAAYIIELDRKGHNDAIRISGRTRLCSKEFIELFEQLGFNEATGVFTDVNVLKPKAPQVNMINLSIGYFEPHTNNEYLDVKVFESVLDRVEMFLKEHKDCIPDTEIDEVEQDEQDLNGKRCDFCGDYIYYPEYAVRDGDKVFCCKECETDYREYLDGYVYDKLERR